MGDRTGLIWGVLLTGRGASSDHSIGTALTGSGRGGLSGFRDARNAQGGGLLFVQLSGIHRERKFKLGVVS